MSVTELAKVTIEVTEAGPTVSEPTKVTIEKDRDEAGPPKI